MVNDENAMQEPFGALAPEERRLMLELGPRWNDDDGKPHSPAWQCPACARAAEQAQGATAA